MGNTRQSTYDLDNLNVCLWNSTDTESFRQYIVINSTNRK